MRTIFAKYNNERLPKYQIVTKIVVDDHGQRYAIKQALCNEAKEHIERIDSNYYLLKKSFNLNLVEPTKINNGVKFSIAKNISLENILLDLIDQNNKEEFTKYVNKFVCLLDTMVTKKNVIFEPSNEFKTIFGEWKSSEPQDIIKVANIDMIFGNIFVDENENFVLIDYEWVFEFEIPKSYILWRSLAIFSAYHSIDLSKYMVYFDDVENKRFLAHDAMFRNFVFGENKKYCLSHQVSKKVDFIDFNKKEIILDNNYFIQLFILQDTNFKEEDSIMYPITQKKKQKFEFDLKKFVNIQNLRLDPLNDSCFINISLVYLILEDNFRIDLKLNMEGNFCSRQGDSYFFDYFDPQIYFKDIDFRSLSIKKFVIELEYKDRGKDALYSCIKQITNDKNSIIENHEQVIQNLEKIASDKYNIIENQKQILAEKDQTIKNLNEELMSIYISKSWKITKPFRTLMRKLKKSKKNV